MLRINLEITGLPLLLAKIGTNSTGVSRKSLYKLGLSLVASMYLQVM